jgi:hypothetical protein
VLKNLNNQDKNLNQYLKIKNNEKNHDNQISQFHVKTCSDQAILQPKEKGNVHLYMCAFMYFKGLI